MVLCTSFKLTLAEGEILERGLNFIPTPTKLDKLQLRRDLYDYHRKLKILDHFAYDSDYLHLPFQKPSTWEPELSQVSPFIQNLISQDVNNLTSFRAPPAHAVAHSNSFKSNITGDQRQALKALKSIDNIIIKPADKGGQIVLQDRVNYLLEAHRQLENSNYYQPLPGPMQSETQEIIKPIIDNLYYKKFINFKQLTYLYGPDSPRPRLFYLLPKIHKPPQSWTVPFSVPAGRPIISDCGSESYRIAEYIDYYLNPLAHMHSSYVKDTYDFVHKLRTLRVPAQSFLFSIDVDSLYTNIETERGLLAVQKTFQKSPNKHRPDAEILELLKITLTRNDFQFADKTYLQICGCAMGRKYSPAYADIYMAEWEESAFQKCNLLPLLYLRYLDDIFGIWSGTQSDFEIFLAILNQHHPKIKLKCNLQLERVEFLDTQVFFVPIPHSSDKKLATKVFFKETDRHALLHKSSYHPAHTFRGLIKSQLIRFHRICSYPDDVEEATNILFSALKHRDYAKRFLREIKSEVNSGFHNIQPLTNTDPHKRLLPLVQTFFRPLGLLQKKFRLSFQQVQQQIQPLQNYKLIMAYRKNCNLRDSLVHTALDKKRSGDDPWLLNRTPFIFNGSSGRGHPIREIITSQVKNVVYIIQCQYCKLVYVGETGRVLKVRIMEHVNNIKKGKIHTNLYAHFQLHGIQHFKYIGVEHNPLWSKNQRIRREGQIIVDLSSISPEGLNEKT